MRDDGAKSKFSCYFKVVTGVYCKRFFRKT